jgi:hypothetical protein
VVGGGECAGGVGGVVAQVGDQAERLAGGGPGDGDVVFDHADGQRGAAAGELGEEGAVRQVGVDPPEGDAVLDADEDVGAGGGHPFDPRDAGEVPVHDP